MSDESFILDDESEDAEVANLGEHRAVRSRNKAVKQQETVEKAGTQSVVRNIMGTPMGRRWMAELLAYCDLGTSTFSPDLTEMAHREGRRAIGYRLLNEVCDACPERYAEMRKELSNVR